jgi:hypothetical protein
MPHAEGTPDRFVHDQNGGGVGGGTDVSSLVKEATFTGRVPDEVGTWAYYAGTAGPVTVGTKLGVGERVIGIAAAVSAAGATVTIDGGDTIPIPFPSSGEPVVGIELAPRGNLVDPVIVFAGTDSFMVEVVR